MYFNENSANAILMKIIFITKFDNKENWYTYKAYLFKIKMR